MYKSVFQVVLLYGRKLWMVTDTIVVVIEVFHHRTTRRIEGMTERKGNGGEWEWDLVDVLFEVTGSLTIREYVRGR